MLKAKCRFAAEYWCRDVPITVAGSLLHIVFVLVEFCQSSDENVPENNSAINKYKKNKNLSASNSSFVIVSKIVLIDT